MKVAKIEMVIDGSRERKIDTRGLVSYLGTVEGVSKSQLQDKMASFKWDIKVASKAMGDDLQTETQHMPDLKSKVLFVPNQGQMMVWMTLPLAINPHLVMSSVLGKPYEQMLQSCRFQIQGHYIELDSNCNCGERLALPSFASPSS